MGHPPENYIHTALASARTRLLDDGTWFAEIPGFDGVWANAASRQDCLAELGEVLTEWISLKSNDHDPLPALEKPLIVPEKAVVA